MNQRLGINPWWSMWVKPKETISKIIALDPSYNFVWLSLIYGFVDSVYLAQKFNLGGIWPFWINLIICIACAIPVGAISFCLTALFVLWTGKLVKAKGTFKEIRASVAWSNAVATMSLALIGLLAIVFGNAIFFKSFYNTPFPAPLAYFLIAVLFCETVLAVWRLVIFIKSLAEVQKISGWMALLNVVLAALLAVILYVIFTQSFSFFVKG